jgi:hypothetical protein
MSKFHRQRHMPPPGGQPPIIEPVQTDLKISATIEGGNIRLDFGKPVTWIVLPPAMAADIATTILGLLKQAQGKPN